MEYEAFSASEGQLEEHDEDNKVEEGLLIREEYKHIYNSSIESEPENKHNYICFHIWLFDFTLSAAAGSGAPANVMIVGN